MNFSSAIDHHDNDGDDHDRVGDNLLLKEYDDHDNADDDHDNVHDYLITSLVVRVRSVSAWQHGNEVVHVLSPHF